MTAIRVEVTAEHIVDSGLLPIEWATPVEQAIAALTDQDAAIDGGGPDGPCVATIGQGEWSLVVDLPGEANRWLDARWSEEKPGEPFAFDIEVPDWIVALVARAATVDEQAQAVIREERAV
jgi:hypothetical protein